MGQACAQPRGQQQIGAVEKPTGVTTSGYVDIQPPAIGTGPRGLVSGRLYAMGGLGGFRLHESPFAADVFTQDDFLSSVEAYDVRWKTREGGKHVGKKVPFEDSNGWSDCKPLRFERSAACAVNCGNRLYVIGGFDGHEVTDRVLMFDPKMNHWETRQSMIQKRSGAAACVNDGYIYVCGGWYGEALNTVERYSVTHNQWEILEAKMHEERSEGLGCVQFGGYVWVMGGMNRHDKPLATVERYDPASHDIKLQWECKHQLSEKRSSCAAVVLYDNIYVIGGFNGKDCLSSVERYDALNDRWSNVEHMGSPGADDSLRRRAWLAACVFDGQIYIFGGHRESNAMSDNKPERKAISWFGGGGAASNMAGHCLSTVERFLPEANKWEEVDSMQVTRASHCVVCLDDGIEHTTK